jgi:hypothetical protein
MQRVGEMMLSSDDNLLLAQTGPETAMGELFRRFWIPSALSSEIVKDGPPLRLRLLGEDLLAFRDSGGRVGILDRIALTSLHRYFLAGMKNAGFDASITVGSSMLMAAASICRTSILRPPKR